MYAQQAVGNQRFQTRAAPAHGEFLDCLNLFDSPLNTKWSSEAKFVSELCISSLTCTGFIKAVQLLREGENQQATVGQTRDEYPQRHAGNSEPGRFWKERCKQPPL